jgi:hypothetical protein
VFVVANAPTGGTFDEAMYVATGGLPVTGGAIRAQIAPASPSAENSAAPYVPPVVDTRHHALTLLVPIPTRRGWDDLIIN